jgi:hypothetical protein
MVSGMGEVPLPDSRRVNHGGITITSGVGEMPLPDSIGPSHGDITITSGVGELHYLIPED